MNQNKVTRAQLVECITKFFVLNNRESELQEHLLSMEPIMNKFETECSEQVKQKMLECFNETTDFKDALTNFVLFLGAVNVAWTNQERTVTLLF